MEGRPVYVKTSVVEGDGIRWWFLYRKLIPNTIQLVKRFGSEEELDIEVAVKYADCAVEIPDLFIVR